MKRIKLSVGVNDSEFLKLVSILAKNVRSGKWKNVQLVVNGKVWINSSCNEEVECKEQNTKVDLITGQDRSEFYND